MLALADLDRHSSHQFQALDAASSIPQIDQMVRTLHLAVSKNLGPPLLLQKSMRGLDKSVVCQASSQSLWHVAASVCAESQSLDLLRAPLGFVLIAWPPGAAGRATLFPSKMACMRVTRSSTGILPGRGGALLALVEMLLAFLAQSLFITKLGRPCA